MSEQRAESPDLATALRMHQLIFGFMALPAIAVAAKLGIADLVADSAKTVSELANATNAHGLSLRRLLQFLAS